MRLEFDVLPDEEIVAAFEVGLELGEGHLDRVEIGAVGRQEAQLGPGPVDGLAHGGTAVGGGVVHHHDVAGLERRHQHLFDVGQEGSAMGAVIPFSLSAPTKVVVFQWP